jgi:hypothetical protein
LTLYTSGDTEELKQDLDAKKKAKYCDGVFISLPHYGEQIDKIRLSFNIYSIIYLFIYLSIYVSIYLFLEILGLTVVIILIRILFLILI